MTPIPITVFTGFLGAGKTTVILSLLNQLPSDHRVVLLKNEFGDVEVDSKLAQQSSVTAVSEILNGCLCCVLVGQMQTALLEIRDKYRPSRIIIECSGSAFPATLAFQIRQLERDTDGDLVLDAIVTVIDAENFVGYEDSSPTAKMQASYTDIILINKWELVSERALDIVMDHLHTLNDETPKIKCQGRSGVSPELIFGSVGASKQFLTAQPELGAVHDEVETATVEVREEMTREGLEGVLKKVRRDDVWRVKGFVKMAGGGWVSVNWAFGRYEISEYTNGGVGARLLMIGSRGSVRKAASVMEGLLSQG